LKKYPLDVHERHIKRPDYQGYFEHKFSAFLGGNCKTAADILDKILLANSLLDHASQLVFTGEMGLVAIHALGIETGRIDRFQKSEQQKHDFDEVKPFMVRLFEKASDYGVRLLLPIDFHCATKPTINIKKPAN
jgi:3-phosphoglycerate kinase